MLANGTLDRPSKQILKAPNSLNSFKRIVMFMAHLYAPVLVVLISLFSLKHRPCDSNYVEASTLFDSNSHMCCLARGRYALAFVGGSRLARGFG